MRSRAALLVLAVAGLIAGTWLPAAGQVTTGTVFGTIKDAQGGVIPGATVVSLAKHRAPSPLQSRATRPETRGAERDGRLLRGRGDDAVL